MFDAEEKAALEEELLASSSAKLGLTADSFHEGLQRIFAATEAHGFRRGLVEEAARDVELVDLVWEARAKRVFNQPAMGHRWRANVGHFSRAPKAGRCEA